MKGKKRRGAGQSREEERKKLANPCFPEGPVGHLVEKKKGDNKTVLGYQKMGKGTRSIEKTFRFGKAVPDGLNGNEKKKKKTRLSSRETVN